MQFGWPAKGFDDLRGYGHVSHYPIGGYFLQAPYPNLSKAATVPSWQTWEMDTPVFDHALVREKMKEFGLSQTALAEELGLNQSAISNLLKGERRVQVHEASYIYRRLHLDRQPDIQTAPIILLSSAGNWREAVQLAGGQRMPFPRGLGGERCFAVEISGDSMNNIIPNGGYVVVDPDQDQLYNDKVYLIENAEYETQVKLYRSNPARFEPASTDETHRTVHVGREPIRVIGRVIWQGAPL